MSHMILLMLLMTIRHVFRDFCKRGITASGLLLRVVRALPVAMVLPTTTKGTVKQLGVEARANISMHATCADQVRCTRCLRECLTAPFGRVFSTVIVFAFLGGFICLWLPLVAPTYPFTVSVQRARCRIGTAPIRTRAVVPLPFFF